MTEPRVSIILPCFNAAEFVEKAIFSIIKQTYTNWELIVIDDASTDCTTKIITDIRSIETARIKLIKLEKNSGVSAARNFGLSLANGKYVCFIDADDYWEPQKLEIQVRMMKETKATLCYTMTNIVNENSCVIGERIYKQKLNYFDICRRNYITLSSAMISRGIIFEKFKNIGHEDYLFWLENRSDNIIGVPMKLTNYRSHKNNMTKNKFKSVLWLWKLYMYTTRSPFVATWYLVRNIFDRVHRYNF